MITFVSLLTPFEVSNIFFGTAGSYAEIGSSLNQNHYARLCLYKSVIHKIDKFFFAQDEKTFTTIFLMEIQA